MPAQNPKKKKVSKRLKSSWRKHVDIKDVEEFLEDQRLDERISAVPLEDLPNEELFQIDIKASPQFLSAKERRKVLLNKPLRCFSALLPHTKVPDPISKRNRVRTPEERKNQLVKLKEEKNRKNGIVKAKEVLASKNKTLYESRKQQKPKRGEFTIDLWSTGQDLASQVEKDSWASPNTKLNILRGIGVVKKLTKSKKDENTPAIEAPHPGSSYNPSLSDHTNLLRAVAEKELNLIKEEKHLTRCTTGMFQKVSASTNDKQWLVEMSEGLPSTSGSTNLEENEASDGEYKPVNAPVKNKKKTLQQRRKQKEQMRLQKEKLELKQQKKKITDLHQIKTVNKQIEEIEKLQSEMKEKRKKKLESEKGKTKKLSAVKYEEPDLEFNMAYEIPGNLKNVKTEGNLLIDRFKSLQRRSILAPTKRVKKVKAKVKKYVRPGHKEDDWKKTVAGRF